MKECSKCEEIKEKQDFNKNRIYQDGLSKICRKCVNGADIGKRQEETDGSIHINRLTKDTKAKEKEYFLETLPHYASLYAPHTV